MAAAAPHQSGRKPVKQPAFPVKVVDPTGAGDAMRAGWYAALRSGRGMEEALRWGQAAAAVAVQHSGPQTRVVREEDLLALAT